jgi:hypothetical protein
LDVTVLWSASRFMDWQLQTIFRDVTQRLYQDFTVKMP